MERERVSFSDQPEINWQFRILYLADSIRIGPLMNGELLESAEYQLILQSSICKRPDVAYDLHRGWIARQ
jgi:hypothetical protein